MLVYEKSLARSEIVNTLCENAVRLARTLSDNDNISLDDIYNSIREILRPFDYEPNDVMLDMIWESLKERHSVIQ